MTRLKIKNRKTLVTIAANLGGEVLLDGVNVALPVAKKRKTRAKKTPTTNTTTKKQKKQHSKPSDDNDSSKDIGAELITRKFWARAIDDDALQTGVATVTGVGVFETDDGDWDTAEYEYHGSTSGTLVSEQAMVADVSSWVEQYEKDVPPTPPTRQISK